ncbi:MAG: molybdopterin-guanine dinucleotide biosynthesis protein B [Asgard group archaeon]|nr:molybdopterin-guanine dinucleotide biosynthesis protein B [Asgard group archaeon]
MDTKIIGITGPKKSGKTTTIEHLVPKLQEKNLRVGTVKVAFKDVSIDINQEHYDVARHRKTNPEKTLFKSSIDTTYFYNKKQSLRDALKIFSHGLDIILIEGFKENLIGIPQIVLLKEPNQENDFCDEYTTAVTSIPEFSIKSTNKKYIDFTQLADKIIDLSIPLFPDLNCQHCGFETCNEFVQALINNTKSIEDCEVFQEAITNVVLKIDQKSVPIKPFVQDVLRNVMTGILISLKLENQDFTQVDLSFQYKEVGNDK